MLNLNVNESCQLTFEVQIGGVQSDQLDSYFKIVYEGVEYGFPAKVGRESITVDIPPLNQVIGKKIKEGSEGEVKLEVIADGNYLTPWRDHARFSNPLVVEAKIKDGGWTPKPTLKTKLVSSSDDGRKQSVTVKESKEDEVISEDSDLTDKIVEKLSKKFASLLKEQEGVVKAPPKPEEEDEEENGEEIKESCGKDHSKSKKKKTTSENEEVEEQGEAITDKESMEKLLTQTLQKVGIYRENEKKSTKKKMTLQEFKRRLTTEDIYRYIEKAGTKNHKIQEIIYEQAAMSAKNDSPVEILRQVINLMKKKGS